MQTTKTIKRKPRVAEETLTPESFTDSAPKLVSRREHFPSLMERVAQSDIYTKNWSYPGGWKLFPHLSEGRTVQYCFPYAKGGRLLIDVPETNEEKKICELKRDHLKAEGLRYLILKDGMTDAEAGCLLDDLEREIK